MGGGVEAIGGDPPVPRPTPADARGEQVIGRASRQGRGEWGRRHASKPVVTPWRVEVALKKSRLHAPGGRMTTLDEPSRRRGDGAVPQENARALQKSSTKIAPVFFV